MVPLPLSTEPLELPVAGSDCAGGMLLSEPGCVPGPDGDVRGVLDGVASTLPPVEPAEEPLVDPDELSVVAGGMFALESGWVPGPEGEVRGVFDGVASTLPLPLVEPEVAPLPEVLPAALSAPVCAGGMLLSEPGCVPGPAGEVRGVADGVESTLPLVDCAWTAPTAISEATTTAQTWDFWLMGISCSCEGMMRAARNEVASPVRPASVTAALNGQRTCPIGTKWNCQRA